MTTSQKGFATPLLLALVALLILGGGAYAYMQNKQVNQPVVAQTSDLKTYTNTEYGFSFQYPPSFGIPKEHISTSSEKLKNSPDSVNFLDGRLIVSSGISYNLSTSQPMTFAEVTAAGSNKKQIIVDGRSGIQVSSSQVGTVTSISLPGNVIVVIEGSLDLQNQILPTFKFSPNSQTSDWKIYTNTSKGYSISYPIDAKIDTSDLSCIRIDTKEFGSVTIIIGTNSDACGVVGGIGIGDSFLSETIIINGKQYTASGVRTADNSQSLADFAFTNKMYIRYGVDHLDKSNPKSWKNLGALTDSEYQDALDSAKRIVSTLKAN